MKTAIITGATKGIGLALAKKYAHEGFGLILNGGHDRAALECLEEELSRETTVRTVFGSVAEEETAAALAREALDSFGHIDLLINNAGIAHIGLLSDMSTTEWHHIMGTNLDAVFYTTRAVIPAMVHRHSGRILNISSVWGEVGASCEAAYSASKGAVNALTKALAKELAPSHISVNAVSFGVIDTAMNACFSEEERLALAEEIPYGRFATPEEAADFCWKVTSSPEYLTGQVIRFDGGWV